MYSLLLPSTSGIGWRRQPAGCHRAWRTMMDVRWMSNTVKTMPRRRTASAEGEQKVERQKLTFLALGLEPKFVKALQTAFPTVKEPTEVQERLLPEVFGNKDILLKDITGSGKSFGLILGLLNKPRKVMLDESGEKKRVVTTLYVVPHRDLAFQLRDWIEKVTRALSPSPELSSVVQVLVRGEKAGPREERIAELKKTPPHILICTPQALKEVYEQDREVLMLDTLSTVVVDEVDYLVDIDERNKKKIKHEGPTREMLNVIYERRKELCENQYDPAEDEEGVYESAAEWRNEKEREEGIPQLILASATLKVQFKNFLFTESGWLNSYNLVKISGDKERGKGRILHSILVANEKGVKNIEGAVKVKEEERILVEEDRAEIGNEYFNPKYEQTPSPFDASSMEAVATAFALDVPSVALLVVRSSVHRAVWELRQLGVNADALGETRTTANPRMLVATVATTRGLDVPELSHVFLLGIWDEYVHVAGRVGRFGRRGRVVTVVSEQSQAARIRRLLAAIGHQPVLFEHFD